MYACRYICMETCTYVCGCRYLGKKHVDGYYGARVFYWETFSKRVDCRSSRLIRGS